MRLYIYVALLTALLYPVACRLCWGTDIAYALLMPLFGGVLLSAAIGISASIVLWGIQTIFFRVQSPFRPTGIRFVGATVVGLLSVGLFLFRTWIEFPEAMPSIDLVLFVTLEIPGFVAAYTAYLIAQFFVGGLAPQPKGAAK